MHIHNLYADESPAPGRFATSTSNGHTTCRGGKMSKRLPATGVVFRQTQAERL